MIALESIEQEAGTACCAPAAPGMSPGEAQQLSADLQLLGHPVRLQLLALLTREAGRVCVCDLETALPVKQPTVSHHLKLLRQAGLIESERDGQWVYYSVVAESVATLRARIDSCLAALG